MTRGYNSHGHTVGGKTQLYRSWENMISRCYRPSSPSFKYYGARGIEVCTEWRTFVNFAANMGPHPGTGFSLERIDSNGNYEPSNCIWATVREQSRNRRKAVLSQEGSDAIKSSNIARSRFSQETVDKIRGQYLSGVYSTKTLAHMYGCSPGYISRIALRSRRNT